MQVVFLARCSCLVLKNCCNLQLSPSNLKSKLKYSLHQESMIDELCFIVLVCPFIEIDYPLQMCALRQCISFQIQASLGLYFHVLMKILLRFASKYIISTVFLALLLEEFVNLLVNYPGWKNSSHCFPVPGWETELHFKSCYSVSCT